ncbi:TlpA family protein disulfide reductase [Aquihabitans sp. McL0605]|uniref:TlpA family protein disulfide reductase n=1 Tax=Aquihabitans sp. McL0605 TaxID=3415671 RepID=UPI003CFA69FD
MVDAPEPQAGEPDDRAPSSETTRPRARTLDRRTVAICFCIALLAALAAGLIASIAMGDDDQAAGRAGQMDLKEATNVDTAQLLALPLDTPTGGSTNLGAHLDEKPMLVNLWQSTCAPCIKEMPLLEQARADNPDVTFVGVASQDRVEKAKELADQTGITYPWALDPSGNFFYAAKAAGMPTTLLLSADGDLLASKTGAFKSQAQLQSFIDQHGG